MAQVAVGGGGGGFFADDTVCPFSQKRMASHSQTFRNKKFLGTK
jgi:hypothetical protein